MDEVDPSATMINGPNHVAARRTLWNFTLMSILFSANHGCVVGKKNEQLKQHVGARLLILGTNGRLLTHYYYYYHYLQLVWPWRRLD